MLLRCLLAYSLILTPQLRDCSHLLRYSFCQNVQLFVVSSDFLLPVLELFLTTFFSFNSLIDFFSSKSHFYSHNVKFFSKYYYFSKNCTPVTDEEPTQLCSVLLVPLSVSLCVHTVAEISLHFIFTAGGCLFFLSVYGTYGCAHSPIASPIPCVV